MGDSDIAVGEKIALDYGYRFRVNVVKRITPTGRIILSDGLVLNPNLTIRGIKRRGSLRRALRMTAEVEAKIRRQAALDTIYRFDFLSSDDELIMRVAEIIGERGKDEEMNDG